MENNKDIEGLDYLQWSLFDSKDEVGSGYKFMERKPVLILDKYVKKTRYILEIELAYVSPIEGNKNNLAMRDSHRVGHAVRLRMISPKKRMHLVAFLIKEGVRRIAFSKEYLYFDTDDLKEPMLNYWNY
jgi:hypothetical protein|tara:strand:- start:5485 stop:5871 length:387 start_codon:yes stop_codon:yes gene_type:complete